MVGCEFALYLRPTDLPILPIGEWRRWSGNDEDGEREDRRTPGMLSSKANSCRFMAASKVLGEETVAGSQGQQQQQQETWKAN